MSQPSLADFVGKITTGAIATYVYLQSIAVNGEVVMSARIIAENVKKSVAAVRDHLNELEKFGLLKREERHNEEGGKLSNRYRLLV